LFVSTGFAGRAGSFRACTKTFRQYLAEKIAAGELFRHAERRQIPLAALVFIPPNALTCHGSFSALWSK